MFVAVNYTFRQNELGLLVAQETVRSSRPWVPLPQPKPPVVTRVLEYVGIGFEPTERNVLEPNPFAAIKSRLASLRCHSCGELVADHCDNCMIPCCPGRCSHESADPTTRARLQAEDAAASTYQGEWSERVYESVTGLRWRCCSNPFTEDHSPWYPA